MLLLTRLEKLQDNVHLDLHFSQNKATLTQVQAMKNISANYPKKAQNMFYIIYIRPCLHPVACIFCVVKSSGDVISLPFLNFPIQRRTYFLYTVKNALYFNNPKILLFYNENFPCYRFHEREQLPGRYEVLDTSTCCIL